MYEIPTRNNPTVQTSLWGFSYQTLLSYFLFQFIELGRAKKLAKRDFQTVAYYLNGSDFRAFAFVSENTVNGSFIKTAQHGERVQQCSRMERTCAAQRFADCPST